jgi:glycosyltransferase involved in cell wall biosynthesis
MTDARRARLLMTTDAVGGVWSYALDLAQGLAGNSLEITLAVMGPSPTADQIESAARVPGLRLLQTGLALEWMAESESEVAKSAHMLAAIAGEIGADLVHLNAPAPAACAEFPAPLVITCHSCVATWWHTVRDGPLPGDFRWRAELVGRGYRAAQLLVAPTAAFAAATARIYDLQDPPLVIHNGRRAILPTTTPLRAPADFAFTAGRLWDEGKDLATLDRAAARIPVPVFAAGDVTGPNGAKADLRSLRLLGRLSEAKLGRWLEARPIFVSPARYEPFGLAVLEAAQAGCSLVLADTPGFRELWQGAAEFVPPGDDAAFAMAMLGILADRERRAALGVAARERAGRYTAGRQVGAMLEAYHRILPGTGTSMQKEAAA